MPTHMVAHLQFLTSQRTSQNCKRATKPTHQDRYKMTTKRTTEKEGRRHNSTYKKLGVQWLIEHSTSHQLLCLLDSFVLRNPQLLVAANRYASCFGDIGTSYGLQEMNRNNYTLRHDIFE